MRIFTVMGVIFVFVGAFFLYQVFQPTHTPDFAGDVDFGHSAAPILAFVFLTIGIIFTIVGVAVTRLMGNRQKLLAQGLPGSATVLGAEETGVLVNERPMLKLTLNVQVPGRPPYTVEHREVVPFIGLGMITPGASLPVAVDPVNPQKLAVDWSGQVQARLAQSGIAPSQPALGTITPNTLSSMNVASTAPNTLSGAPQMGAGSLPLTGIPGAAATPAAIFDMSQLMSRLAQSGVTFSGSPLSMSGSAITIDASHGDAYQAQVAAMRSIGAHGTAVIRSVQDMGVAIRGDKLMELTMDVTPDGGTAYPVQHYGIVPPTDVPKAVAGANVTVYVDRNSPQNLVIDWNAA